MFFVYSIQSEVYPECYYLGITTDVMRRLNEHHQGKSLHTKKFIPWKLLTYVAFVDKMKAIKFETHLKTGSGRAFCKKHF